MRQIFTILNVSSLALILIVLGCSKGKLEETPSKVVEESYWAANENNYSKFESFLSAGFLAALKDKPAEEVGGLKWLTEQISKNGTISKIEILNEEVSGKKATVSTRIHYKDGNTVEDRTSLIKEERTWKISP